MKLHLASFFAVWIAIVHCAVVERNQLDHALAVTLSQSGGIVLASITNSGYVPLKLLSVGNILDERDIEKVSVTSAEGVAIPFGGLNILSNYNDLPESAFTVLEPGENKYVRLKPMDLYDMSKGDQYDLVATGTVQLADLSSTILNGQSLSYESEVLNFTVDAQQAAAALSAYGSKQKRAHIEKSCGAEGNPTSEATVRNALSWCKWMSEFAEVSARQGTNKHLFYNIFGVDPDQDHGTRDIVAAHFAKTAELCGVVSPEFSIPRVYCGDYYVTEGKPTDPSDGCAPPGVAYTILPSRDLVSLCPGFEKFPLISDASDDCWAMGQVGILIHEFNHLGFFPEALPEVYNIASGTRLTTQQALMNADSYRWYAQGVWRNCHFKAEEQRDRPY